ncbi:hypothetical protein BH10PAT3_BH10PAT3_5740 [soil metagenome]
MKKNQTGFAPYILVILLVIAGVGIAGLMVMRNQQSQKPSTTHAIASYADCVNAGHPVIKTLPSECEAEGKTYTDKTEKSSETTGVPAQKYLEIAEWGIRLPVSKPDNDYDMVYTYRNDESSEAAFFTFQRLVDYGICKSDIGVALSRSTVKNSPPYNIDNPEQLAHLGDYYYSTSYGGSYCYDSDNAKDTAFYTSTGITTHTVTDALKKLELTSSQ